MTSDPKAPDAVAEYLYREDVTDQLNGTRTFYERIKVFTDKGRELATMRESYVPGSEKVTVQARTIHADGTVIPYTEKPADLVDFRVKGYQQNVLVINLPDVQAGSILEVKIAVKYIYGAESPDWLLQQAIPIRKAHYSFKADNARSSGLAYSSRIATDDKVIVGKSGSFTLDMVDIPALPDEDWMPPLNTFKWRVSFFYSGYSSGEEFWNQAAKTWADAISDFINPTGTLKKAAAELVAPGDTEIQKAQKIYAAVMKLENTDFTREKSQAERKKEKIKDIHNAQDVWREKLGNSDQIALLFVALCRAAGLNVVPMKVVDRSRALFDSSVLNSRQMDDYIAVAQLGGKEFYLDPGEAMCPFAMLHWKHAVTSGFRFVDKSSAVMAVTPTVNYKSSYVQRVADLQVKDDGVVTGTVRMVLSGQDALRWRQIYASNDDAELKKLFTEWMKEQVPEGVQVEFDHFLGLNEYESKLLAFVKVSGTVGTTTGKRFFLPGEFFEVKAKHPFVAQQKRIVPVDVHYGRTEQDDVTYRLPDGYVVESGPASSPINWQDHAVLKIVTRSAERQIGVVRDLAYNYTILGPAEYDALRGFYRKVAEADQQPLVLTRAGVAKVQ